MEHLGANHLVSTSSFRNPLTNHPLPPPRSTLEAISSYSPTNPKTVIIASYPKSGTTWMQNLVYQLLALAKRRTGAPVAELSHISDFCPFLENDKAWDHSSSPASLAPHHLKAHGSIDAAIFNTHLYMSTMPAGADIQYVYVTRDARDVCNSFYHHLSHQAPYDGGYTGGRSEFVRDWSEGSIAFGPWGTHLKEWLENDGSVKDRERCLRVDYSEMKRDLDSVIRSVASHLGMGELSREEVAGILPKLSVGYMKANIDKFEPKSVKWVDKGDGFR